MAHHMMFLPSGCALAHLEPGRTALRCGDGFFPVAASVASRDSEFPMPVMPATLLLASAVARCGDLSRLAAALPLTLAAMLDAVRSSASWGTCGPATGEASA